MSGKERSLIITGDDFGFSGGVNRAIIEAHEAGVLTNASLMVAGEAFEGAVSLARQHPRLAVGLHLVLSDLRAALPARRIPHLVDGRGKFSSNLFTAGFRYQCHPAAARELRAEIRAQLEKFRRTGLRLSHVDGHQQMHMTPIVLRELVRLAGEFGIRAIRIPSEEFRLALRVDRSGFWEKGSLSVAFGMLRSYAANRLKPAGICFPNRVYGLLQSGRMTEDYLLKLIPQIRSDRVEIYVHPTTDDRDADPKGASRSQLDALLSGRVRQALDSAGFRLSTYAELN